MIRVLVVDDHELIRLGLEAALENEWDLLPVASATDGASAMALVAAAHPDVVVMDLSMPGMDGIEATRRLAVAHPLVRVLILSWRADTDSIDRARAAGASGYLLKETPGPGVVEAIRAVHAGRRPAHDVSCAARRPTQ